MNKILDVVEDIKQNITDNQYKISMDSLTEVHKIENKNIKSFTLKCFYFNELVRFKTCI